ncbi:MAG TPA: hypothetical protein V6C97_17490 [Oculatellaceae cyanobacterium]
MVDEVQPKKDDQEQKEILLRRRAEADAAMKAFRFTREKDQQFSIDMGDGTDVQDRRPLRPHREITSSAETAAPNEKQTPAKLPPEQLAPQSIGNSSPAPLATSAEVIPNVPPIKDASTHATPSTTRAMPLSPSAQAKVQQLAQTFGVVIKANGSHLEYIRLTGGRELSLFSAPSSTQGLASAENNLKKITTDVMNMLSTKFGISFSKVDEVISHLPLQSGRRETTVFARQASLPELDAIADSLYPSDPAYRTVSGTQVKFCFVDQLSSQSRPIVLDIKQTGSLDVYICADAISASQNQSQHRSHSQHSQSAAQQSHALARCLVEAFAEYSVYKAASMQSQLIPDLAHHLGRYRSGPAERKSLLRENMSIYQRTKDFDQWEINKYYGLQADGTEVKLRLPNGKLVNGKPEMRDEIHRFEETTN